MKLKFDFKFKARREGADPVALSLGRLFGLFAGTALLLLTGTGVGLYLVAVDSVQAESTHALRLVATAAANDLGRSLALAGEVLDGLAQDPELTRLVAGNDPARLRAAEERLTRIVPNALLVRLVADGQEVQDEQRAPRMGFADLDLVHQALTSRPPPSMHVANSPDAHIALARHLVEGTSTLLASLSPKLLTASLPQPLEQGALELKQGTLSLAFQGDAALRQTPPEGTVPVPGTPWTLDYHGPASAQANLLWFLATTGLAAVLVGGTGYLAWRWLADALRHDQDNIVLIVRDLLAGNRGRQYAIRIENTRRLIDLLAELPSPSSELFPTAPPTPRFAPAVMGAVAEQEEMLIEIQEEANAAPPASTVTVSPTIFRSYDIRGVAGDTLTPEVVQTLGRAIGSEARDRGEYTVAVAHDGRLSGPELCQALVLGLRSSGCSVIDLGLVPTPVLYFATHVLNTESGVIVTGSHNGAEYNGLKIVLAGEPLAVKDLLKLRERIERQDFTSGSGQLESRDILPDYMERIVHDTQLGREMKIVIDAGNGATCGVAPKLFEEIGCEVVPLNCEIDGRFPNHPPDPSRPDNLRALVHAVRETGADLGIAFDGDGDSLGVVDSTGKIIWPDRQLMVFAADVLSREPGSDIIFDVKCTRHLAGHIVRHGGRPLMWKTGHSALKAKLKESGALLAGEMNGHIIFKERWYGFDDGLYAAARLVEILSGDFRSTAEMFAELPDSVSTPELYIPLAEGENVGFIEKIRALANFPEARVTTIDGLRVDFADGWGLIRASNTVPALALRFEADNPDALSRIQSEFKTLMQKIKPGISFPLTLSSTLD